MAIFYLQTQSISRGAGRSAPAAAAYRAGERIRDERTGLLHNYSRRDDVTHAEILLPSQLAGAAPAWATERSALWNAVERHESRRDARLAREYQVALPAELNAPQRLQLARTFAQELSDRHRVAVDLAVHEPRRGGDPRNFHAHLLVTSRELTPSGLGAKAGLDMYSLERARRGLLPGIAEIKAIRERWGALTNQALLSAGHEATLDHRSLRERGIDREPQPRIPYAAVQLERRGVRSEVAERIRAQYRVRVEAREQRARLKAASAEARSGDRGSVPQRLELLRQQAREAWLALRTGAASTASDGLKTGQGLDAGSPAPEPAESMRKDWGL